MLKSSKQLFMVPFERDSKFVGRTDIIAELDQKLDSQRRVALAGIGGIGKSQIAIEYCYRFRDKHPDASVFWVHVGTISRFKQAYEAIANGLGLVIDDPKANNLQLVTDWLNNEENGSWLMILDNADDQAVFESRLPSKGFFEQSTPLIHYLPHSQQGSIIITTRDKRVGERLTFREKPLIVSSFDEHMAKALLRSRLDQSIDWVENDIVELIEALDFLPLAVTQAASFISENNIAVKNYTDILRASDSGLTNLLNQDLIDLKRDFDASSSIIRTWQVSFDQIRIQNPRAAELLSLMAVLDRQGISKTLLCEDDAKEQVEIITALGTLQAFSLISSDKEAKTFEMHRLVQLSTLMWLEMQNEKLKWQDRALQILSAKFPSGKNFETWEICALYLPHVMIVIDTLILGPDHVNELGLFVDAADYLRWQGQFKVAEQIIRRAIEIYKKTLGDAHSDTLRSMTALGDILNSGGKYDDAETLLRKVLMLRERSSGGKDELTLSTIRSLACVLNKQAKHEEAKKMLEQNVKVQLGILGGNHENMLADMEELAKTYWYLDQLSEAEELQVQLLKTAERVLGPEHPHTLSTMDSLAVTYYAMNRLNEAEKLEVQVVEKSKRILGAEHPDTLHSMANLAVTYSKMNRLNETKELEVRVLEKREKVLGSEHPATLLSMINLAVTYSKLDQLAEAEELEVQVLEKSIKVLGVEHPGTLRSMNNLAATYHDMNRFDEAEELEMRVLKAHEKILGAEHRDTLSSMANLARTWKKQNHLEKAISLMSDAVRISKTVLDADDPDFRDRRRWLNRWIKESSQNAEEETEER